MTYAAPNFAHIVHKPMPKNEIAFELEPLAQSHRGFESRLPPIPSSMSVELLVEREGRARNAKKASEDWDGLTVHFAHCEEVQRSRGAL